MNKKNLQDQGQTQTIVREQVKEPRKAKVIIFNDHYTTKEFVVQVLMEVFFKSFQEATMIMLLVHERGRGLCGVYPLEIAETKVRVVHKRARENGFPLRCSLELT